MSLTVAVAAVATVRSPVLLAVRVGDVTVFVASAGGWLAEGRGGGGDIEERVSISPILSRIFFDCSSVLLEGPALSVLATSLMVGVLIPNIMGG